MSPTTLIEPAWVWLHRLSLDRRIAHGADPATDTKLARRARQLTSRRSRAALADGIQSILDEARAPRRGPTAAVPVQRHAVLTEARLLQTIASDLAQHDELSPRGIALVEELLRDGSSPIYAPKREGVLHGDLVHAHAALHLS